MSFYECRQFPRIPLETVVYLELAPEQLLACHTLNASITGFAAQVCHDLKPGLTCRFHFPDPDGLFQDVRGACEVVWCESGVGRFQISAMEEGSFECYRELLVEASENPSEMDEELLLKVHLVSYL